MGLFKQYWPKYPLGVVIAWAGNSTYIKIFLFSIGTKN
jgi:hypothetical protein